MTEARDVPLQSWLAAAVDATREVAKGIDLGALIVLDSVSLPRDTHGAFVGLTAESHSLELGIVSTEAHCVDIASQFAGTPLETASDVDDALGELASIVVGSVKRSMVSTIPDLAIGLPTFVSGSFRKAGAEAATAYVQLGGARAWITVQKYPSPPEIQLQRRMERELRATHAELQATSKFLRDVFRAIPGCLVITDGKATIEVVNKATIDLFEFAERDLIGKPLSMLLGQDAIFPVSFDTGIVEAPHLGAPSEISVSSRTGTRIPVLCSATATYASDQGLQHVVYILHDARERKRLEFELRQAQKLEAIGRLSAGIAHEINTPTQFVSDSIYFLREAMEDLRNTLNAYRALLNPDESKAIADKLAHIDEEFDVAYLWENIPSAIDRSIEGLGRIATIVRSMKEFAHPDAGDAAPADLNQAIRNTLIIAHNEYKYVANIKMDLNALPPVVCHSSDLNQAILNIIVNAAHAVASVVGDSGRRGLVTVRTWQEGEFAAISIQDTGCGIPPEIRDKVFEPFFTTKEVGHGTGQGLAMARSIVVDKHGEELNFESEVGKGTTFLLRLPIAGPRRAPRT